MCLKYQKPSASEDFVPALTFPKAMPDLNWSEATETSDGRQLLAVNPQTSKGSVTLHLELIRSGGKQMKTCAKC